MPCVGWILVLVGTGRGGQNEKYWTDGFFFERVRSIWNWTIVNFERPFKIDPKFWTGDGKSPSVQSVLRFERVLNGEKCLTTGWPAQESRTTQSRKMRAFGPPPTANRGPRARKGTKAPPTQSHTQPNAHQRHRRAILKLVKFSQTLQYGDHSEYFFSPNWMVDIRGGR